MLVSRVLGDCPGCKTKNAYGNVGVYDYVLRGCGYCKYESHVWLPPVKKKVIYLDQFFFSNAMRGADDKVLQIAERVRHLCHLQLLVAPFSSVHEDESRQWRGHAGMSGEQLLKFIKTTARGAKFKRAYEVEHTQVYKAWEAFLKSGPIAYELESRDAIDGRTLNSWDNYVWVDVNMQFGNVDEARQLKAESVEMLLGVVENWRKSTYSFERALEIEGAERGRNYVKTYLEMVTKAAKGDISAMFTAPMAAGVVQQMIYWLPKDMPFPEQLQKCMEFFQSQHYAQVPGEWISNRIYATLRDIVRNGAFAKPEEARKGLTGAFEDIKHISTYAPYCDAIVIDRFMADLVCRATVGLDTRYGVKVFGRRNWDELLAWLDEIEAGMTDEHRQAIAAAYPTPA